MNEGREVEVGSAPTDEGDHDRAILLESSDDKDSDVDRIVQEPKQPNKSNAFTLLMAKKTKETGVAGCDPAGVVTEAPVPKKRGRPKKNQSDKGEIESDKAGDVTENEQATRPEGIDESGVWSLEHYFSKRSTQC